MSDPVFTPAKRPPGATAPGSAQLVYLRELLFAIKGIYHHPLTDADAPLPPHRWAVVNEAEQIFIEGTTSGANGISMVPRPDTVGGDAAAEWTLWLIPTFDDGRGSSEVASLGEVWIDVDKNAWIRPSEFTEMARIESRRALRLPRWTSARKAVSGGGFREALPGAADFPTTGTVKTSELAPHGTLDAPWVIAIDEGWLRTFVQLRFYDPVKKAERSVPKGLLLEAQTTDAVLGRPARMGASSVLRDDGSIYIVHARNEAKSTDLDYQFQTPQHTTFTYAAGAFTAKQLTDLSRLENEYPLAPLWHSFDMEAWEGAVDASPGVRKAFSAIRTKGTSAKSPISFHLDDAVLTSLTAPATIPAAQRRLGLYTALAGLHDPAQSSGKDLPYSKLQASVLLRAEQAMFRRGKGFEDCTRFIDWEGELHDVSTLFVTGIPGATPRVGARAADRATPLEDNAESARQDPDVTSGHRTYLFDTRWVRHTHQGISARLAHLVCYVSTFIDGQQLNRENHDAVDILPTLLVEASKRWDQKHPGIPGSAALKKDYVVIPATGFKAGSTLLKVRHVFGLRSLIAGVATPPATGTGTATQAIIVQVDTQPGRATGGRTMRLFCQGGPTINPPANSAWLSRDPSATIPKAKIPHRSPDQPYEFEPEVAKRHAERIDGTALPRFAFAHELGHESGLLDEYLERIDKQKVSPLAMEFVPRFDQFGIRARPYFLDTRGMMKEDQLPRLRYIWNYVDAMHRKAADLPTWFMHEAPFVLQYVAGSRTLTHAVPRNSFDWKVLQGGPWTATPGTQGLCNLSFYPTSHDEGMVGPAVLASGLIASGQEFDGLLVIHPMIWVTFDAGITDPLQQWQTFAPWATLYFSQSTTPHFAISTPAAPNAKRVVLVFQPRFEFGPSPSAQQTRANATFELHITTGGVAPTFAAGTPPVLTVDKKDVGAWILPYALLTQPAAVPRVNKNPTRAADLAMLPQALATMLGRPEVGTVVAYGAAK